MLLLQRRGTFWKEVLKVIYKGRWLLQKGKTLKISDLRITTNHMAAQKRRLLHTFPDTTWADLLEARGNHTVDLAAKQADNLDILKN